MITITIGLPIGSDASSAAAVASVSAGRSRRAEQAAVSIQMAALVLHAAAAPAGFIATKLVAGAGHHRRRHRRFRPRWFKPRIPFDFDFGLLAPPLSLLGITLLLVEFRQPFADGVPLFQLRHRQRTLVDRHCPCVLLGFRGGFRTQDRKSTR